MYDVVVLGAGISGIYTAKYMKEEGLSVVVLEKDCGIGGVWRYKDSPGGVIASTITTSSKVVTEASDYPMNESVGDFPTHQEMLEYYNGYVDFHNIRDCIKCNVNVVSAEKNPIDDLWYVTDSGGNVWKGKNFVVATGANTIPHIPKDLQEKFANFNGEIVHSSVYKKPEDKYSNKRILMVGGGETGADIATELSYHSNAVTVSIRNGQWFGDRMGGILNRFPLEHFSSRARRFILDGDKKPELFWVLKLYTEYKGGFHGHGIECWRCPFDAYATSFINKNTAVLERIKQGIVHAKPGIQRVEGNTVFFNDGTCSEFDMVMFSTGYEFKIDWLKFPKPEMEKGFCVSKLFKMCIHPEDTSLAFIGFARPVRGSIPSGAEIQAWMYAYFLSGRVKIPCKEELYRIAKEDKETRDKHFGLANARIATLCPVYDFCDDIAKMIGIFPDYKKLYRDVGLVQWVRAVRTPFHMSQYRLNTPEGREYYFKNVVDRFLPNAPPNILVTAIIGRIGYFLSSNFYFLFFLFIFLLFTKIYLLLK